MVRDWSHAPDGELLRSGDPDAFSELYVRYEAIVAGSLMRASGDRELTADLTAETFAVALLKAERFRDDDGAPAVGWLLGIARHALLRTWERGRTEQRACRRLGIDRIALDDAALERVEALADAQDPANALLAALEALPATQREAVRAHVLHDLSCQELAHRLGVPAATVRQRVSRGLTRIRTRLQET